jgi:pyruvate dehydrogenase E1 component alpha subunit
VLQAGKVIDQTWLDAATREITQEIDAAFAFAEASPFPDPSEAYADLYSKGVMACL